MHYDKEHKRFVLTKEEEQKEIDIALSITEVMVQSYPSIDEINEKIKPYLNDIEMIHFLYWLVYAGPIIPQNKRKSYDLLKQLLEKSVLVLQEKAQEKQQEEPEQTKSI